MKFQPRAHSSAKESPSSAWRKRCKDSCQALVSVSSCPFPCICEKRFCSLSHTHKAPLPLLKSLLIKVLILLTKAKSTQPVPTTLLSSCFTSALGQVYCSHTKGRKKKTQKTQDACKRIWLLCNALWVCCIQSLPLAGSPREPSDCSLPPKLPPLAPAPCSSCARGMYGLPWG